MSLTIADVMSRMPGAFLPEKAAGLSAIVHFKFTGPEAGEWNAVIQNGVCEVAQGIPHFKPTVTLTIDSADFIKILMNQLDGQQAFMDGRIKMAGDTSAAMSLIQMFRL